MVFKRSDGAIPVRETLISGYRRSRAGCDSYRIEDP